MRLKILASVVIVTSTFLTACETMTSSRRISLSAAEKWVILPIENLSSTPLAADNARSVVETRLRAKGVKSLALYEAPEDQNLIARLNNHRQMEDAIQWARNNGIRYGVTGKVQEWHYKNGLDNEPSVGLNLKFLDLHTGEVLWQAAGSRTGWGYSNLASVADKTVEELLSEVRIGVPKRRKVAKRTKRVKVVKRVAKRPPATPALAAALPAAPDVDTVNPAEPTENLPVNKYLKGNNAGISNR